MSIKEDLHSFLKEIYVDGLFFLFYYYVETEGLLRTERG